MNVPGRTAVPCDGQSPFRHHRYCCLLVLVVVLLLVVPFPRLDAPEKVVAVLLVDPPVVGPE